MKLSHWNQQGPKDQLVTILMGLEGWVSMLETNELVDKKICFEKIYKLIKEVEELHDFLPHRWKVVLKVLLDKMDQIILQRVVLRQCTTGTAGTPLQKSIPALHHEIVLFQDAHIPVAPIEHPGHKDTGIAPADRAGDQLQHGRRGVDMRCDHGDLPAGVLVEPTFRQPLAHDGVTIGQVKAGFDKDSHVAGPCSAFTRRAIGRDIAEV